MSALTPCPRPAAGPRLVYLDPVRPIVGDTALVIGPDGRTTLPLPRAVSKLLRDGGVLDFCKACNPRGTATPVYHLRDPAARAGEGESTAPVRGTGDPFSLVRSVAAAPTPAAAALVLGAAAMEEAGIEMASSEATATIAAGRRAAAARRPAFVARRVEAGGSAKFAIAWATARTRPALAAVGFDVYLRILPE